MKKNEKEKHSFSFQEYATILAEIKKEIKQAQVKAVNRCFYLAYHQIVQVPPGQLQMLPVFAIPIVV